MSVEQGVPQGSIIGLILFIILINDLSKCVPDTKVVLFADDTSVFVSDNSLACLVSRTNAVMAGIRVWLILNRLTLNEKKTEYIVFFRKHRSYLILPFDIYLGDTIIKKVRET